jgi:hypothetical protein
LINRPGERYASTNGVGPGQKSAAFAVAFGAQRPVGW